MAAVHIGLGANLDDPAVQVLSAIQRLAEQPSLTFVRASSLYRSAPISEVAQPDFINAVALFDTALSPEMLLSVLFDVEEEFGRRREFHHAPRTLDLDLLLYDALILCRPELQLPHPRMHLRAFVLKPLLEISPEAEIAGRGSAASWLRSVESQAIQRLI